MTSPAWVCGSAEAREKMGLSKEAGDRIIKGQQNQRLIGSLQSMKSQGTLTLSKLLDMKESGVEVENFVGEDARMQLYSKEVRPSMLSGALLPGWLDGCRIRTWFVRAAQHGGEDLFTPRWVRTVIGACTALACACVCLGMNVPICSWASNRVSLCLPPRAGDHVFTVVAAGCGDPEQRHRRLRRGADAAAAAGGAGPARKEGQPGHRHPGQGPKAHHACAGEGGC
jgi:hypothetical protein